ncbi:MAG TPA: type II secretion system protein GspM [Burkholderiales bacterium]|nr:type II secretion system protein GspM [Burkholderiales bacterium]
MKQWWIGLSRRERLAVIAASVLVGAALLYLVGIEPAWRARNRLAAELPRLRAEAVELDALAAEAKNLKGRTRAPEAPAQTKAALGRMLAERNIAVGTIRDDEDRLVVSARRADAAAWLAWLQEVSTELPLRVSSARLARVAPGVVDADVTLTPVGPK